MNKIDFTKTVQLEKQLDPKRRYRLVWCCGQGWECCIFIQSIYHEFGSGFIPKNTGVVMQNRGSFFSFDPNQVNCLEPQKTNLTIP